MGAGGAPGFFAIIFARDEKTVWVQQISTALPDAGVAAACGGIPGAGKALFRSFARQIVILSGRFIMAYLTYF
jgi:hypothetical protein